MGIGFGGDKNSPKTTQQSSSTTKNTQIGGPTTAGANSTVGGSVVLSDLTGVDHLNISTTDQGAVSAGLNVALKSLDNAQSDFQAVNKTLSDNFGRLLSTSQENATTALTAANQSQDAAIQVAQDVANGQQNVSLKYILYGLVAVAGIGAFAYVYRKGGN